MKQEPLPVILSNQGVALYVRIIQIKKSQMEQYSEWTSISARMMMDYSTFFSEVTVRKYMNELKDKGYIEVQHLKASTPNQIRILRNLDGENIV